MRLLIVGTLEGQLTLATKLAIEKGATVTHAEDIEQAFEGLPVKEFCVFAANYIWASRSMVSEQLVLVIHLEHGQTFTEELRKEIVERNSRLLNFKRVNGIVLYHEDFPLTASLKIIRVALAERLGKLKRDEAILPV